MTPLPRLSLRQRITAASIPELADIARALMAGRGPRLAGQPVILSHANVRALFAYHRPEVDFAEVDELLQD